MLIKCPECELQVSDKALFCPHCGYPMRPDSKQRYPRNASNRRKRLPNGFGQISEIKNRNLRNPFRAMITVGKTPLGRPICKPLKPESYFPTYNDAYAALVEYNKNPYDLSPGITVKELYEKWSEEHFKTLKSDSGARAISVAWLYCSSVYNMRVLDVRARHVKGCIDEGVAVIKGKKQRPNPYTKNYIKSTFNQMLDYALEYELVDRNYARSFSLSDEVIKDISTVKKSHIAFTDEEMNRLWDHAEDMPYVDALLIQCYSGWRPQELGLLELKNIDLENWIIKGGIKTEAGIDRIIPIHSRIRDPIMKRFNDAEVHSCKYLFSTINPTSHKEKKFSYDQYKRRFAKIRESLNLNPEHRPHDGRTHFVTTAKKYGVDEYAIKYIVGHNISDITEKVYTKREFEWLRNEIEKIR